MRYEHARAGSALLAVIGLGTPSAAAESSQTRNSAHDDVEVGQPVPGLTGGNVKSVWECKYVPRKLISEVFLKFNYKPGSEK